MFTMQSVSCNSLLVHVAFCFLATQAVWTGWHRWYVMFHLLLLNGVETVPVRQKPGPCQLSFGVHPVMLCLTTPNQTAVCHPVTNWCVIQWYTLCVYSACTLRETPSVCWQLTCCVLFLLLLFHCNIFEHSFSHNSFFVNIWDSLTWIRGSVT